MPSQTANGKKVLLVGWDAADWKIIHPLLDQGKMPNLKNLVENGVMGNLATLHPDLSPMLWTSIATGKRPFKHGIHGFTEPAPHDGGIRPITNLSRKTKAIWNILSQNGFRNIVVGWWPSHPVEPVSGVMVSNHYKRAAAPFGNPWPMPPNTVHPDRITENLAELRVHPQELDPGLIQLFVPRLAEIDQESDHRVESIAKITAECITTNRAATAIMHHEAWDFAAVYLDGIDHYCHAFMRYHPPRLPWVSQRDFDLYNTVVESGYRLHDLLLGDVLKEAGPETTVILVSDHGFHSDHLRPRGVPREPAGPAVQHRGYGVFAIMGPGIKRDEILYGAGLLDICPTILTLLGLPLGQDMDGKPLVNVFEKSLVINYVSSWDDIPGPDGMHPPDRRIDAAESREAIRRLVELGYIDEPPEDREKAAAQSARELTYNLARSYMDAHRHPEAAELLQKLHDDCPEEYRFGIQLVHCYMAMNRLSEAKAALVEINVRRVRDSAEARKKLNKRASRAEREKMEDLSEKEIREIRLLRSRAGGNDFLFEYLLGSLLLAEGDHDGALSRFRKAEELGPNRPELFLKIGETMLAGKNPVGAERNYRKVLSLDPENPIAHLGLCDAFLARRQNRLAANFALDSVGLLYHNPKAHFKLGVALHRMGRLAEAVQSIRVALSQNPNFPEAYQRLAHIYRKRLGDSRKADEMERRAREAEIRLSDIQLGANVPEQGGSDPRVPNTSDRGLAAAREIEVPRKVYDARRTVIIVSGLPRSGTSMMMQMLKAGGIPVMTDAIRTADEDNPKGYFEYEPARQIARDSSWLPNARGRAVKIVAQLLPFLPASDEMDYRVIFMERNMGEVLASQKKMLERQKRRDGCLPDDRLADTFAGQITRVKSMLAMREIPTMMVDFGETIKTPRQTALRLEEFLPGSINPQTAVTAVLTELYRIRKK